MAIGKVTFNLLLLTSHEILSYRRIREIHDNIRHREKNDPTVTLAKQPTQKAHLQNVIELLF